MMTNSRMGEVIPCRLDTPYTRQRAGSRRAQLGMDNIINESYASEWEVLNREKELGREADNGA